MLDLHQGSAAHCQKLRITFLTHLLRFKLCFYFLNFLRIDGISDDETTNKSFTLLLLISDTDNYKYGLLVYVNVYFKFSNKIDHFCQICI